MSCPVDQEIVRRVDEAVLRRGGKVEGEEIRFRCPCHDDRRPSARWHPAKAVWHCDACKAGGGAIDLAGRLGVPPEAGARVRSTRRYEIRDQTGAVVAVHVRRDYDDGSKRMYWERDGRRGLSGLKMADLPLYGSELLPNADPDEPVFLVEGEKAAAALRTLGVLALGTVTGAGTTPSEAVLRCLEGRRVHVWPDSDGPGQGHMRSMTPVLGSLGIRPRWIAWPDAPPGGDAADFVESGGTADDLDGLVRDAKVAPSPVDSAAPDSAAHHREGSWAERIRAAFKTAPEIEAERGDGPVCVGGPWAVAGAITSVDGLPKAGGKTTLVLGLVKAVLEGADFLGFATRKSPVVYLTEEHGATFHEALEDAGLTGAEDLHILSRSDIIGAPWPDVVAVALEKCAEVGASLMAVDTFTELAGLRGDDENSAGQVLRAIEPLHRVRAQDIAVLVLRHERKSQGDVGSSGRGSNAITGAVDTVVTVRRPGGRGQDNVRVLTAISRFRTVPQEMHVRLTEDGFEVVDSDGEALRQATERILKAAPTDEASALPEKELFEEARVKRSTGQRATAGLLEENRLRRTGAGKKGSPYCYWSPNGATADSFCPNPSPRGGQEETGSDSGPGSLAPDAPRPWEWEPEELR